MATTFEEAATLADKLSPDEKLKLVKHIVIGLEVATAEREKPQNLRGIWKGKFPENINVEDDIRQIRDEWKKKFEDL